MRVDKAVEIDTHHSGFAVHRPVLSRVVSEIRNFLTEAEGRPPDRVDDRPPAAAESSPHGLGAPASRCIDSFRDSREKEQK